MVWQAEYDAFGKARIQVGKIRQPFRLAGQYYDEETGLHYNLARYYDPQSGRFLTRDPLFEEGGSGNFYIYCDGDPVNRLDSDGEFLLCACLIGAAIGAAVETYRQSKAIERGDQKGYSGWGIAKAALVGGVVGAVGGGVGAAVEGAFAVGVTATVAGGAGVGALSGAVSSVAEQCAYAAATGESLSAWEMVKQTAADSIIGGVIGAVTGGVGGVMARRARKGASEVAEKAIEHVAEKAVKETAEETAEKAAKEAAEKARKEAASSDNVATKKISDNAETNAECKHGHPVDAVTGEVIEALHDFTLYGRLPLVWNRYYASRKNTRGACGHNWQCPADARLAIDDDGNVLFFDGSPNATIFRTLPTERPVMEGVNGAVLKRIEGWLIVRLKSGLSYSFANPYPSFKQLAVERIADACGNYLQFRRIDGNLTEVADNCGPVVKVAGRDGLIFQMDAVKADGTLAPLVRYEYDDAGELVAAMDALGAAHRFEYARGMLTRTTNRNGVAFCYEYDGHTPPRCVHTYGPDGLFDYRFTYLDHETRGIDSLGNPFVLKFDDNNLLIAKTDKKGATTRWEYDEACCIAAVIDPAGKKTVYRNDRAGNLTSVTRPDGRTLRIEYDHRNNPVVITDYRSNVWIQHFNAAGQLVRLISPVGAATRYEYNPKGDLIAVTDPLDARTRFNIDEKGDLTSIVDPAGEMTSYAYDAKNRLLGVVRPSKESVRLAYDDEDNLTLYKDEAGRTTRLEYCGLNELSKRQNPDGTTVSYHYDKEENLIGVTNERDETLRFIRDHAGRVVEEIDYWGNRRRFRYDPAGTLLESTDPLGRATRYTFDPLKRLTSKIFDNGKSEIFAYDENGNLIEHANKNATIRRTFDADNRLIKESSGHDVTVVNTYDLASHRIQRATSHGNQVDFSYDPLGNVTAIAINGKAMIKIDRDRRGNAVKDVLNEQIQRRYDYDEQGCLIGQQILWGLSEIKRSYEYDPVGNLIARKDSAKGDCYFSYDPCGRIDRYLNPEGENMKLLYDQAGDLLRQRGREASELRTMVRENAQYQFDDAGNLASRKDENRELYFHWDENDRLIRAEGDDGTIVRFAYDAQGRRIAKQNNQGVTAFAWNADCILSDRKKGRGAREFVFYPRSFEPLAVIEADKSIVFFHNDIVGAPQEAADDHGKIVWSDGNVVAEGLNLKEGGGVKRVHPALGDKARASCAETTALTSLANDIGPNTTKEDLAKLFNEKGYTIETYEGNKRHFEKGKRYAANPCEQCKEMIQDIGIEKGVFAHNTSNNRNKLKSWNGESTYKPMKKCNLK